MPSILAVTPSTVFQTKQPPFSQSIGGPSCTPNYCPPGSYFKGTQCQICPANTAAPGWGPKSPSIASCTPCPYYTWAPAGSAECMPCSPGNPDGAKVNMWRDSGAPGKCRVCPVFIHRPPEDQTTILAFNSSTTPLACCSLSDINHKYCNQAINFPMCE